MSLAEKVAMERGEKIGQTADIRSDWRAGEYSRESCHGERREDRTDSRISDQTGEQVSIAESVAMERGKKIGRTVGYQIRLESR